MSVVASAGVPMVAIGIIVTVWPLTAAEMPAIVAVSAPLSSVVKLLTYFEDTPSQPQLLAPGPLPLDWYSSVMEVRQAPSASTTSDSLK
jgi:hypothetical protein